MREGEGAEGRRGTGEGKEVENEDIKHDSIKLFVFVNVVVGLGVEDG